jgi:hypothetical protein
MGAPSKFDKVSCAVVRLLKPGHGMRLCLRAVRRDPLCRDAVCQRITPVHMPLHPDQCGRSPSLNEQGLVDQSLLACAAGQLAPQDQRQAAAVAPAAFTLCYW